MEIEQIWLNKTCGGAISCRRKILGTYPGLQCSKTNTCSFFRAFNFLQCHRNYVKDVKAVKLEDELKSQDIHYVNKVGLGQEQFAAHFRGDTL